MKAAASGHQHGNKRKTDIIISGDAIIFILMVVVSLELNIPYVFDQLDFHHCMKGLGKLSSLFVPGGAPHPLVIMNKMFIPLKLMIRTISVGAVMLFIISGLFPFAERLKYLLVLLILGIHVLLPQSLLIQARVHASNDALAHDGGVLQIEEAMKFTLSGINPYVTDYKGTPLENWRGFSNNIVYHLPYMPGAFLFPLPFYWVWEHVFHWYDQRVFYMLLFIVSVIAISKTIPTGMHRNIALAFFGLNPMFTRLFALGTNDIFIFSLLILAVYYFIRSKRALGYLFLAAACAVKQFAWFFVPLLVFSDFRDYFMQREHSTETHKDFVKRFLPGALVFFLTVLPYLIADFHSFFEDTFLYGSGGLPTSYPVQGFHGYGFATVLLFFRMIPNGNVNFPFILIQFPIVLALYALFVRKLHLDNSIVDAMMYSGIVLWFFLYFSRYFHGNFLGFTMFWPVYAWCLKPVEKEM